MTVQTVRFNTKNQPEFFNEVRKQVGNYFKENNISRHADFNMKFKTFFMLSLYFTPLALMIFGVVESFWGMMGMWFIMSLGMSGIGLAIMHDANHGSYSRNKRTNKALGFMLNFIGGYHINWIIQHNVLHHSFTNIHEHDEDISKPVMRFSPDQKRKKIFKYQLFYAPFFYGLMTIYWLIGKDFEQLIRYNKRDLLRRQGLSLRKAVIQMLFHKTWYILLTVVLPIAVMPLPWWSIILGFLMMQFFAGLILACIFQPAHVIPETEFFKTDETGSVENNWAIHQLKTTANYANGSRVFSWLIGGLNYQIEHHLFPNICHVHYRHISKIVKQTAKEYDLPYHHHKSFYSALKSHFTLINDLGTGKYDKRVEAQLSV